MIKDLNSDSHPKNPENLLSRRRFFYQSRIAIFTTALLSSCTGVPHDVLPKNEAPTPDKEVLPDRDKTLAFFGNSLTIGAGGTAPYGNIVAAALQGRPVVSDGIVGQVASRIAAKGDLVRFYPAWQ